MVRTLFAIALACWMLLAAAVTFVPGAWSAPSGTLDVTCDRDTVPRGVDSLVRCTYTATNTSDAVWERPQIFFQPAANVALPDRYFFFTYWRDGVEERHEPFQTNYEFGRIEPGASSEIELEIIIKSQRDFGADVALSVVPGDNFIAHHLSQWRVTDDPADALPPLYGSLVRTYRDESGAVSPGVASFTLVVRNTLAKDIAPLSIEVFAPDYGVTAGLDNPQRLSASVIGGLAPSIAAGGFLQRELRIETRGPCAYGQPAVVLRGQPADSEPVIAAILPPDEGTPLNCEVIPSGFPGSGDGGSAGGVMPIAATPLAFALAAAGLSLTLLGSRRWYAA